MSRLFDRLKQASDAANAAIVLEPRVPELPASAPVEFSPKKRKPLVFAAPRRPKRRRPKGRLTGEAAISKRMADQRRYERKLMTCRKCQKRDREHTQSVQQFKNGKLRIRVHCKRCKAFIQWKTLPNG